MSGESKMFELGAIQTYNSSERSAIYQTFLKDELKNKIIGRRKRRGLSDLEINNDTPRTYEMTAEEQEKDKKRRQSNRQSARKSRMKQREEEKYFAQLYKEYEDKNMDLELQVRKLEREKAKYISELARMIPADKVQRDLQRLQPNAHRSVNQVPVEPEVPREKISNGSVGEVCSNSGSVVSDVSSCVNSLRPDSSRIQPSPPGVEDTYVIQIVDTPSDDCVSESGIIHIESGDPYNQGQNIVYGENVTQLTENNVMVDDKGEIVLYAYELPVQDNNEPVIIYVSSESTE